MELTWFLCDGRNVKGSLLPAAVGEKVVEGEKEGVQPAF